MKQGHVELMEYLGFDMTEERKKLKEEMETESND